MGAFLIPADKLARVLPKHANALDLPFRWRAASDGRSVPFDDLFCEAGRLPPDLRGDIKAVVTLYRRSRDLRNPNSK